MKGKPTLELRLPILACAIFLSAFCVLAPVHAGDYYIYKDAAGKTTISNMKPTEGTEIVTRYDLNEVSNEEVRAAQSRDETFWLGLKLEALTESYNNLATELRASNARAREPLPIEILFASTVAVQPTPRVTPPGHK